MVYRLIDSRSFRALHFLDYSNETMGISREVWYLREWQTHNNIQFICRSHLLKQNFMCYGNHYVFLSLCVWSEFYLLNKIYASENAVQNYFYNNFVSFFELGIWTGVFFSRCMEKKVIVYIYTDTLRKSHVLCIQC